jgi:hypothetical protein
MAPLRPATAGLLAVLLALASLAHGYGDTRVGDYQQCGGTGGACKTFCNDGPWTDYSCDSPNAECQRINEYHWQCNPMDDRPSGVATGQLLSQWSQCGGLGSECKKYGQCDDSEFPGFTCAPDNACVRLVGAADTTWVLCQQDRHARNADACRFAFACATCCFVSGITRRHVPIPCVYLTERWCGVM